VRLLPELVTQGREEQGIRLSPDCVSTRTIVIGPVRNCSYGGKS